MKITNETKIGALTSIAIVLLILGFNFLKGKDLFSHSKKIYAVFKNVDGLGTFKFGKHQRIERRKCVCHQGNR